MQVTKWTGFKNHLSDPGRDRKKKIVWAGLGPTFFILLWTGLGCGRNFDFSFEPCRAKIAAFAGLSGASLKKSAHVEL